MVELPELNDDQRLFLKTIFDHLHKEGMWPTYLWVENTIRRTYPERWSHFDLDKVCKSLPDGFASNFGLQRNYEQEAAFIAPALYYFTEAEEEMSDFIRMVRFCVEKVNTSDEARPEISSEDLSNGLDMQPLAIRKMYLLLQWEPDIFNGSSANEEWWRISLRRGKDGVRRFEGVESFEQYLEKRTALTRRFSGNVAVQSAQSEPVNNVPIFEPANEPDPITFNRRNQEDDYRSWVARHRNDGLIVVKDGFKWRVHHAYCPHITGPINQGKNLLTYHKICSTNLLMLENEARKHNGHILKNCPACHEGNEIEISRDKTLVFNTLPRRLRIFLCHSSGDKPVVHNLYQRLKDCNIDPWLDKENLLPGQDWQQEIRKAVRLTDVVIVCLSRESINKTGFVQKEIKFALDVADEQPEGTIFLIPLKLEECGIPERLSHLHAVNYFEEDSFDKLLSALKHRSESLNIDLAPIDCQSNIDKNTLHSPQTEEFALLRTLKGHSGAIWSVAISLNGQLLASGSQDTTLKIWNLHTGELLHTFKSYSGTVYSISISPDGRTIVSGNSDGTIKIWNLATGELLLTLDEHSHFINSLAMSPDGQIIATGSGDNTIKVWDLQAKQLLYTLSEPVNRVAISPDGKVLVSGDKMIKVWNLTTGELLRTLSGHSRNVNSIAISLDGQIIATGSSDRTIKVWNLQSGKLLRTIRGHTSSVIDIVINSDEQTLASVSYDNSIKVWNLHTGVLLHTLVGHSDNVFRIAFSSDGQLLASGSKDTTIKIWERKKLVS